jgi:hypothetical protein
MAGVAQAPEVCVALVFQLGKEVKGFIFSRFSGAQSGLMIAANASFHDFSLL